MGVLISGCAQQEALKEPPYLKNESWGLEKGPPSQNQENLPICKTTSATNCRIVEGITQGGKDSSTNESGEGFEQTRKCNGEGTVSLISPMKLEDVGMVIPMGAMIGGHVTPIDHMYFSPTVFRSEPDTYDVFASADGVITYMGIEQANADNKNTKIRLVIMHTCDFYSIYNLLTSLSPELFSVTGELSPGKSWSGSIDVTKGQRIGKIGGQTLDLSVNYDKHILEGFVVPEHYEGEYWKIHTVDPFNYFEEPDRSNLLEKNLRDALPLGGKIDYDIDGRLAGNWFEENTGGYNNGGHMQDYWKTHLSFAYDHIDPTHIIISMGDYNSIAKQAAVKGNSPNPKDVSVDNGLVKYELTEIDYVLENGQSWDRMTAVKNLKVRESERVIGVVLVEMMSGRKIKFEAFSGEVSTKVQGFTENSKIYER